MIRIRQIKVDIDCNDLKEKIISRLKIKNDDLVNFRINKRSIDARLKPKLFYIYEVDVEVLNEEKILVTNKDKDILKAPDETYNFKADKKSHDKKIIVVGMGPAGLFCSYML